MKNSICIFLISTLTLTGFSKQGKSPGIAGYRA